MFETQTLEQLIRQSGVLGTRPPSSSGWHTVNCRLCGDYKPRGGFLFDHGSVAYKCFNCGTKTTHKQSYQKFQKDMYAVLIAFGIDMQLARRTLFQSWSNPTEMTPEEEAEHKLLLPPPVITLPAEFEFLNSTNPAHAAAIVYVESRKINYRKYGLMVSNTTNSENKWFERVIVPVYNRSQQFIFYQGRSYTGSNKRWDSPRDSKQNVLFGYHNLDDDRDTVIVCEGTFDAMSVDGVSILGSEFSQFQANMLNQSRKTKIIVPNKDKNGYRMATQALALGFNLSFPDFGDADDINTALQQYGRMYVEQQILQKIATTTYKAELKLGVWCAS